MAGFFPARRLRVLCGSAADPLNLIQVMLAKGCPLARASRTRFLEICTRWIYDCQQERL